MRVHRELLKIAMLGTSRRSPLDGLGESLPARLGQMLDEAREESPERTFLKQAAIVSVYRRAGKSAARFEGLLATPAEAEERKRCREDAARRLGMMLGSPRERFLPEWCAAVERSGRRAPEELLPALLDLATRRKEWRDAIRPLLGRRGIWLAQLNPAWSWIAVELETPPAGSRPSDEDCDLLEALLDERMFDSTEEGIEIFDLLPAERQESCLIKALLRSASLEVDRPAYRFLIRSRQSWGPRVGKLLLPMMRREVEIRQARAIWDWRDLLRQAGQRLDPRMASEAEALLAGPARTASPLAPALAELLDDLRFRAEMMEEIDR